MSGRCQTVVGGGHEPAAAERGVEDRDLELDAAEQQREYRETMFDEHPADLASAYLQGCLAGEEAAEERAAEK